MTLGREHDDEYEDDGEYEAKQQLESDDDGFEALREDQTTSQEALDGERGKDAIDEAWGND